MTTKVVSLIYDDFDHAVTPGSFLFIRSEPGESHAEYLIRYQKWFYASLKRPRFKENVDALKGKRLGIISYPNEGIAGIVKDYLNHQEN